MIIVQTLLQEETFTFTPEDEEEEIHIFSGQLRKWLLANAMDKVIQLTFPDGQTEEEIIKMHGLEEPRMKSMNLLEASEPVIIGLWPSGHHVLIDGGHRRWFWWKRGVNVLKGWAVPTDVWMCFRVSAEELSYMTHHKTGASLPQRRGK